MPDFTIEKYKLFIITLKKENYSFCPFSDFLINSLKKVVVLRHDVDLLPLNSLMFARIQAKNGIRGSYYFRAVPESWNLKVIKEISDLGHEIGYHYESMDTSNGDIDKAWDQFRFNLQKLRSLVDVKTICMHGSPKSKFDNRELWLKYDYKSLGIIGEPYYDIDFNKVLYLTDTGRRWDGWKFSVRDKVPQQDEWINKGLTFHSTNDIIYAVNEKRFPDKIMLTFHPQRWTSNPLSWTRELIMQNAKNQAKKFLIK